MVALGRGVFFRSVLLSGAASFLNGRVPAVAFENEGALGATCVGFGCNDYRCVSRAEPLRLSGALLPPPVYLSGVCVACGVGAWAV